MPDVLALPHARRPMALRWKSCLPAAAFSLAAATAGAAQTPDPLPVCVGADRVVRHAPDESCPAGQTLYRLAQGELLDVPGKEGEKTPADVADLLKQMGFLRERLAQLEKHVDQELESVERMSHQVMAPFEVVDKKLNPILLVTDEDSPKRGRVTIRRAGGAENYAIQFVTPGGLIPAQLGIGKSGAGILAVTDAQGRLRAEMWGERGIEVFSSGGQEVAALGMDDASNGALQLNSSGGQVMVTAGTEGPRGSVRTRPGTVCSGNMGLKAPDCLLGRLK